MRLVIAEKPELARNIARAVCGAAEERPRLPYRGSGLCIVACAGHLLELQQPDEADPERWGGRWSEETLPVLPVPWPKVVAKGKEDLVATIADELAGCDSVIHAGDPDDEGQLIVDELLEHLGWAGKVERVLVNDNIDKNIRRAFDALEPNERHVGAGRAANARAIADFCFGATESRLATIRAGHGRTLSVGRVQTPTLGLVVRRDEEIAAHVASAYFAVTAEVSVDGADPVAFALEPSKDLLDEGGRLSDRATAERAKDEAAALDGTCETKVSKSSTQCPLPYNLTDLTSDMSKRHKMGAKRVMEATQSLRDNHRAITYNRSDCQYLPAAALEEAPATLARAMANIGASWELDFSLSPRCFDDSKIDAHTGIIPQDIAVDASKLSADEAKVYSAVVERYAMQFAGPEEALVSETQANIASGSLVHKAKRVLSAGWRAIRDDGASSKGFSEGWVDEGAHAAKAASTKVEERKTKPRPPYTEGTLVKDMANAAKYVSDPELKSALKRKDEGKPGEHGSIGTTATRAQVIETLKARGFVTEQRGRIVSTRLGREFYHACPPEISGVDTTARWWLTQERVAAGELDEYAVARDVCEVFEHHRDSAWKGATISGDDGPTVVGPCPICGQDVLDKGPRSKKLSCSSNHWAKREDGTWERDAGCGFEIWREQRGHALTATEARDLLTKGKTRPLTLRSAKTRKSYRARLTLEGGKVGIEFVDGPAPGLRNRTPCAACGRSEV